ncbi:hypothetical protein CC78DRAFT_612333 [Lojkania enalia]|uniref:BRCT domain-containing protein n=1 Tax=Lojkania enalia TaxID=147567 RepID=A0A9P4TQB6_9PLEO|nr:hypothetical protein CC78DRAFT_612333 [Didymosphaeria enalia]
MASAESQQSTLLRDDFYDDPEKLSQLLRQRTGSEHPLRFTTPTDQILSVAATGAAPDVSSLNLFMQAPALHPAHNQTPRRAPGHSRHVKPTLTKHHTAPTSKGFMMEREGEERMYQTFDGALNHPGDTQPDSQIYKNWTSALFSHANDGDREQHSVLELAAEPSNTPSNRTDGVNAVESSQEGHSQTITSPAVMQENGPDMHIRMELPLTSPLKFETPVMAGGKRDSHGQIQSSAMRTTTTPGTALATAFGASFGNGAIGNGMSLTQAFQATQAGTSPAVGVPSEDIVFQRPSPNFTNGRHSSPIPTLSSPTKVVRSDPPLRSSSEPRVEYGTIRLSPEQRRRDREDQSQTEYIDANEQDSWTEPTESERRAAMPRAKEQFEKEIGKSFARVTIPSRTPPRRRRGRGLLSTSMSGPMQKTPTTGRVSQRSMYDSMDKQDQDDDSPDELSQGVPSSARPVRTITTESRGKETNIQVPNTSSHPRRTQSGQPAHNSPHRNSPSQLLRKPQGRSSQNFRADRSTKSSREPFTIMDSQPDMTAVPESVPRPRFLLPSSPSTNQYSLSQTTIAKKTSFTSQIVSSIPPMPPRSSSQILGETRDDAAQPDEERIPSSPPALRHEDDFEYDEHSGGDGDHHIDLNRSSPGEANLAADGDDLEMRLNVEEGGIYLRNQDGDASVASHHEVPETAERPNQLVLHSEEDELVRSSQHEDLHTALQTPLVKRRLTIPESDMLKGAQPSYFDLLNSSGDDDNRNDELEMATTAFANQTSSTNLFHTARETQCFSHSDEASMQNGYVDTEAVPLVRSLNDIANQPDTQQLTNLGDIDIPKLSFTGAENDFDAVMFGRSPARPAAKKQKLYSVKKNTTSSMKETDPSSRSLPSPLKQVQESREITPPSAEAPEKQGSPTAANAREEVVFMTAPTLKSGNLPKPSKSQLEKKGALKPVNKNLLSRKFSPKSKVLRSSTKAEPSPDRSKSPQERQDVNMASEFDELAGPTPTNERGEAPSGKIIFPNRVFAYWPGGTSGSSFYPATCIGHEDEHTFDVLYDDGGTNSLEAYKVRAFDLQIGDQIRIDEAGKKKNIHVVIGFKNKIDVNETKSDVPTDRRGYSTVVVEIKNRDSAPKADLEKPKQTFDVPMSKVYLTNQLWNKYGDRVYSYTSAGPSNISTPYAATPLTGNVTGPSVLKSVVARAGSESSFIRSGAVFSNMAFAVTITLDSTNKDSIINFITSNGGILLEEGFHELFNDVDFSEGNPKSSPTPGELSLKPAYKSLGFVALISDSHSRRTKYIEALALNIPCLHYRWLTDSVSQGSPLGFGKYLLPAGLSTFLRPEGAVRSRTMDLYDPDGNEGTFEAIFQGRQLLLKNQSVLLVWSKLKKGSEKRTPYLFLTHALGPNVVGMATSIPDAKEKIETGDWDWVYVESGIEGSATAERALFGAGGAKKVSKSELKSKKRKRDESVERESMVKTGMIGDKKVRVVCDEFVVQSLILGALVEV